MGNHAGKDGIGHTVSSLDFFHTPPSSPSEEAQLSALASASSSVFTHQMQTPCGPCLLAQTPSPSLRRQPSHREWALISMESPHSPETSPGPERAEEDEAGGEKRRGTAGALISPAPTPTPWSSTPSAENRWQEKDSGLESPRGAEQVGQETSLVMQSLMEYYRATSGLGAGQDDAVGAVDLLRRLVAERGELSEEVQGLKETLRTERTEWRQFQSDLQVAVSVADRLRADAEQALGALRERHVATEAQLAQALRRQRETDGELRDLQAQHRDARHQLTALLDERRRREGAVSDARGSARDGAEPDGDVAFGNAPREGKGDGGKEDGKRGNCALVVAGKKDLEEKAFEGVDAEVQDGEGHRKPQRSGADDGTTPCCAGSLLGDGDPTSEETQLTGKGVAEAYILRLAAIKKKKEEEEAGNGTADQRRIVMLSERSWSLSRLPLPDNANKSGPSPNSSATLPLCKKEEPAKGRKTTRSLQRQDSWGNFSTKKQDEDQTSDSRPQDGFSVLLRRHGGSRRNALLRWCQTRTQGYKNIDITNFSSSWEDGLAFCAIFHSYMPSHIPYGSLTPQDKKGNLDLAFQTGNYVGITTTLTVEEILKADGPTWQRVLGYVESIFRHFEM